MTTAMAAIEIGTLAGGVSAKGTPLRLELELATESLAIVGKKGKGKTTCARVFVEEFLDAGVPVVIFDPTDVWWGLRSSADGKTEAYPVVVFGGRKADVPLPEESGAALAELLVHERINAVLSCRHMSKKGIRRFAADFCERLYELKGDDAHREPLHVVVDEADIFCPQDVRNEDARCMGAIDNLVRRGRSSGIGVSLISQRPAVIHKNVLTQSEVLITFALTGPHDKKAIKAWIEDNADEADCRSFLESLAGLPKGTAWFWAPGSVGLVQVAVRRSKSFDSSYTPKLGERRVEPKAFAAVDLAAIEKKLGAAVEEIKANDPRALKAKIQALEAEVKGANREIRVPREGVSREGVLEAELGELRERVRRFEIAGEEGRQREALQGIAREVVRAGATFLEEIETLRPMRAASKCTASLSGQVDDLRQMMKALVKPGTAEAAAAQEGLRATRDQRDLRDQRDEPAERPAGNLNAARGRALDGPAGRYDKNSGDEGIGGGKRRMLEWLAREYPGCVGKDVLGVMCGITPGGGTHVKYLGQLKGAGLVEYLEDGVRATTAGLNAAGSVMGKPIGPESIAQVRAFLGGGGMCRMFDTLLEHPKGLFPQELGVKTGMESSGGTFVKYLGKLRTWGIVTKGKPVKLTAAIAEACGR